jgi:hypothetical protein
VDVSDATAPREIGALDASSAAWGVWVAENRAYLAHGFAGLRIVDISDLSVPADVGSVATPDYAHGVAVSGNLAFVADWDSVCA